MSFIPLDDKPGDVPCFDACRLQDILVMDMKAFDSVEQIDNLLLFAIICFGFFFNTLFLRIWGVGPFYWSIKRW